MVSIGSSCSGKLVEQSSELAWPGEERRVGTRNLNRVDTKAWPGDCSAELDADGRVVHGSDGRAGSLGKLAQGIWAIPQASRVLRAQPLKGPLGIAGVAVGVEGELCRVDGPEDACPILQRLGCVGPRSTHVRRVIPRPAIDVWEYAAEEYQRDAGGAVATSGNTIAPSECPTNTASSRSAGYDESTTSA